MSRQPEGYTLVTNIRRDTERRRAFNQLAGLVFGLDFEPWFQRGFWTDSYLPFTLFDGDVAVANASVNRFTLVIHGKRHRAIQFGTVMTHPDYRGKGLASFLMRNAMDSLRDECDLFYLMGDKDALGFYRKLGFEAVPQTSYRWVPASGALQGESPGTGRWLNMDNPQDIHILMDLAAAREPVSMRAGVLDATHLLTFYALNGFGEKFWYVEKASLLAIFEQAHGVLALHDLLFRRSIPLVDILPLLPHGPLQEVSLGFTPDRMELRPEDGLLQAETMEMDDAFFVMPANSFGPEPFLYPPIALA